MHLIVPYAASHAEDCLAAVPALKLPNLQKLLNRLTPLPANSSDEFTLSPPHERALAHALGLPVVDGQIPWAALAASQRPERIASNAAWGRIDLCHWQVNTHHITMSHLPLPELNAEDSDALLTAMRPYFEEDGIGLCPDEPGRWLAQGEIFAGLATASPDRVVGRNLAMWLPESPQAATLRRLQNEMQMLLYTHPVYDARAALGLAPVNSFWLSGTGALPAGFKATARDRQPTVATALREAGLTEDWSAWAAAWQTLDATLMADLLAALARGEPVQLTLCGERHAQTWAAQPLGLMQKIKAKFASQPLSNLLKSL
jgi:hypothetical protein